VVFLWFLVHLSVMGGIELLMCFRPNKWFLYKEQGVYNLADIAFIILSPAKRLITFWGLLLKGK